MSCQFALYIGIIERRGEACARLFCLNFADELRADVDARA